MKRAGRAAFAAVVLLLVIGGMRVEAQTVCDNGCWLDWGTGWWQCRPAAGSDWCSADDLPDSCIEGSGGCADDGDGGSPCQRPGGCHQS